MSLTATHWLILSALEAPDWLPADHGTVKGVAAAILLAGWRINTASVQAGLCDSGLARCGRALTSLWSITPKGRKWIAARMAWALDALAARKRTLTIAPRGRLAA